MWMVRLNTLKYNNMWIIVNYFVIQILSSVILWHSSNIYFIALGVEPVNNNFQNFAIVYTYQFKSVHIPVQISVHFYYRYVWENIYLFEFVKIMPEQCLVIFKPGAYCKLVVVCNYWPVKNPLPNDVKTLKSYILLSKTWEFEDIKL